MAKPQLLITQSQETPQNHASESSAIWAVEGVGLGVGEEASGVGPSVVELGD